MSGACIESIDDVDTSNTVTAGKPGNVVATAVIAKWDGGVEGAK